MSKAPSIRNRWDQKYTDAPSRDRQPEPLLVAIVESRAPGRALDIACGLGRNSVYLAAHGWEVTGVDYSAVALHQLRDSPVTTILADLEKGEYKIQPESWDLIVDCCYLQRSLFPAIKAGVKLGGVFAGIFPMSGIKPEYLMKPGEGRELFDGWKLLHYSEEGERVEMVAEQRTGSPPAVQQPDKS